jgi:hypothetical protein
MPALIRRAALVAAALAVAIPSFADDQPLARVEFRRAETAPAAGLVEATVSGTRDKVYLHKTLPRPGSPAPPTTGPSKSPSPTPEPGRRASCPRTTPTAHSRSWWTGRSWPPR